MQRLFTGEVEEKLAGAVRMNGRIYAVAGRSLLDRLEPGNQVIATWRSGVIISVQKLQKNPVMRSLVPPKPPEVGDLVSIDQVIGVVTAVRGLKVSLRVKDGSRFIGSSSLTLRATTSLKILRRHKAKEPVARVVGEPPVASGVPKEGPLAEPLLEIDGDARGISMSLLAAKQSGNDYAVTVLIGNAGPKTLCGYELSLDFQHLGKAFNFGALRVGKESEAIPPGVSRRVSIKGSPLLGKPRRVRLLLSALKFR